MPPLVYETNTLPIRLYVILTSTTSGGPLSGVPFFSHAAASLTPSQQNAVPGAPYMFTRWDGRAYSLEQVSMAVIRTAKQA